MIIGHKKMYGERKNKIGGELNFRLTFNKYSEYTQKQIGKKISFLGKQRTQQEGVKDFQR